MCRASENGWARCDGGGISCSAFECCGARYHYRTSANTHWCNLFIAELMAGWLSGVLESLSIVALSRLVCSPSRAMPSSDHCLCKTLCERVSSVDSAGEESISQSVRSRAVKAGESRADRAVVAVVSVAHNSYHSSSRRTVSYTTPFTASTSQALVKHWLSSHF